MTSARVFNLRETLKKRREIAWKDSNRACWSIKKSAIIESDSCTKDISDKEVSKK